MILLFVLLLPLACKFQGSPVTSMEQQLSSTEQQLTPAQPAETTQQRERESSECMPGWSEL